MNLITSLIHRSGSWSFTFKEGSDLPQVGQPGSEIYVFARRPSSVHLHHYHQNCLKVIAVQRVTLWLSSPRSNEVLLGERLHFLNDRQLLFVPQNRSQGRQILCERPDHMPAAAKKGQNFHKEDSRSHTLQSEWRSATYHHNTVSILFTVTNRARKKKPIWRITVAADTERVYDAYLHRRQFYLNGNKKRN